MPDSRECAAVVKVACRHCQAPAGFHCANAASTIVWPPHLSRMDAYTHRLDPSEDWPMPVPAERQLQHVRSKMPDTDPMQWQEIINEGLRALEHSRNQKPKQE